MFCPIASMPRARAPPVGNPPGEQHDGRVLDQQLPGDQHRREQRGGDGDEPRGPSRRPGQASHEATGRTPPPAGTRRRPRGRSTAPATRPSSSSRPLIGHVFRTGSRGRSCRRSFRTMYGPTIVRKNAEPSGRAARTAPARGSEADHDREHDDWYQDPDQRARSRRSDRAGSCSSRGWRSPARPRGASANGAAG